jgi:hypothetical protein
LADQEGFRLFCSGVEGSFGCDFGLVGCGVGGFLFADYACVGFAGGGEV